MTLSFEKILTYTLPRCSKKVVFAMLFCHFNKSEHFYWHDEKFKLNPTTSAGNESKSSVLKTTTMTAI